MQRPTIKQVNLLLLLVVCLQASNLLFVWLPPYVRLILNQALFILLPTLIYLRWVGLPIRETVKWRWPGGQTAVLAFLIGAGLYPLSIYLLFFFQVVLGYSLPEMPEMVPATHLEAALALIALAVMAPICEEFLFRGVAQNAYAHHGPTRAILFVGFLFIAFHLSLLQGLSIIFLALALGFVYWRTASLPAAMLTHLGANLMAVITLTSGVWIAGAAEFLLAPTTAVVSLVIALLALWLLTRAARPELRPDAPTAVDGRLAQGWPLLAALPIFLFFMGAEIFIGRSPELLAPPIALDPLPWEEAQSWRYQISNIIDDPIGHATCTLTPEAAVVTLVCEQEQEAYEVRQGQSYWSSIAFVGQRTVQWRRDSYAPLADFSDHALRRLRWTLDNETIRVEVAYSGMDNRISEESLPPFSQNLLVTSGGSWPWQLTALPFRAGLTARFVHIAPDVWRPATQDMGPVTQVMVVAISGPEEIETPDGARQAWRAEVGKRETGRETAWYSADAPHTLLRYFNGMETWTFVEER
jgi:membrane protease YdiL (CAAX protease family)